jgi:uncharacterized protein (DUF433 family)
MMFGMVRRVLSGIMNGARHNPKRSWEMTNNLIHDRGRGPEIVGTRITVYNLLPHFLDATATEAAICRLYELTPEQVAAARAYVLNNPETVLVRHMDIEARMAEGNPPEVIERAKQTHAAFLSFKDWLAKRQQAQAQENAEAPPSTSGESGCERLPTFREWLTVSLGE